MGAGSEGLVTSLMFSISQDDIKHIIWRKHAGNNNLNVRTHLAAFGKSQKHSQLNMHWPAFDYLSLVKACMLFES